MLRTRDGKPVPLFWLRAWWGCWFKHHYYLWMKGDGHAGECCWCGTKVE